MINFLGALIFLAIITIGSLDGRSGLGLFSMYRSAIAFDMPRPAPTTERRWGGDTQPTPPAPAG